MKKLNNNSIPIHEFSIGVHLDSTETGSGIVSLAQKWMNVSFPDEKIPYLVERAIANDFFSATGTETEPTIIGRLIPGIDGNWSVVAINNLVKTIHDELIPVSRFFVTPGNTLEHLVNWVQSQYLLFDAYPIFNPFQALNEKTHELFLFSLEKVFLTKNIRQELSQEDKENTPMILTQKLVLTAVYQRAEYLANLTDNPVSFAYQAVNLQKCRSFQVIHTCYEEEIKEVITREHIAINPNSIIIDEDKIKEIIKRLIYQEAFSLTALTAFMREVTKSGLTDQYWHKIFDDFGASMALTKEIAPPMMIKLLTLRCLALPETEQEFMAWIRQNNSSLITEVYNDFRGKLLRNISSFYGDYFNLFSLDDKE
ncbi:MAG: hypothetical protein QNJ42_13210 [Crocosphaera sp.]|nr:hypothetical protein [Crocosphaera sp.]